MSSQARQQVQPIILRYSGASVDDGSFETQDLINGLDGFVSLASIIYPYIDKTAEGRSPSVRIVDVRKGCFEVVLQWIEAHPALMSSATLLVCATIGGIAHYLREGKTHSPKSDANVKKLVEKIIEEKEKGCRRALQNLSLPLDEEGVRSVSIGLGINDRTEIANENNFSSFYDEGDSTPFEIHRSIAMEGKIRALNKNTLVGKFEKHEGGTVYPIKLIMKNPAQEFLKFHLDHVNITGVATYSEDDMIKRIEVEKIDPIVEEEKEDSNRDITNTV